MVKPHFQQHLNRKWCYHAVILCKLTERLIRDLSNTHKDHHPKRTRFLNIVRTIDARCQNKPKVTTWFSLFYVIRETEAQFDFFLKDQFTQKLSGTHSDPFVSLKEVCPVKKTAQQDGDWHCNGSLLRQIKTAADVVSIFAFMKLPEWQNHNLD